jgi:hypothetical protein
MRTSKKASVMLAGSFEGGREKDPFSRLGGRWQTGRQVGGMAGGDRRTTVALEGGMHSGGGGSRQGRQEGCGRQAVVKAGSNAAGRNQGGWQEIIYSL